MIILENIITDAELNVVREFYEAHKERCYVNWQDDDKIIDTRCMITAIDSFEFTIIEKIAKTYFKNPLDIWAGYQRQTNPHNIHIDDYGINETKEVYTFVLSFDTIPEFKTFVWKEQSPSNAEFHKYVAKWGEERSNLIKVNNLSETEDLEHTKDINQDAYMCDYLEIDGIYTYRKGCGVLFNAKQFHCTSNWVKYNRWPFRELLQIHVSIEPGTETY
jgi:hypothetical protein